MKTRLFWSLFFLAATGMANESSPSLTAPLNLAQLRAAMDRQIARLGSIVMHEEISRYDSARGGTGKLDEFNALVEVVDGADRPSLLRRNGRPCPEAQIRGAWSFGDFSSVLRISRDALDTPAVTLSPSSVAFHFPASSARWFVSVNGRPYWLEFQGEIRLSGATGDLERISWISTPAGPESEVRQVQRSISFASVEVAGETFILPAEAEYRVIHSNSRVERNSIHFSNPARYSSLVSVKFDD